MEDKPLTLKIQEAEQKVVDVLNEYQLPAYVLKTMLERLYNQVDQLDKAEIAKYQETLIQKESDK